jgi:hypothetical protein
MRWAKHVACKGVKIKLWKSQNETDHKEYPYVDGGIILKRISEKQTEVVWAGFIWFMVGIGRRLL